MSKWLIDFDSTLSDTFAGVIPVVNAEFGTNYTPKDFVSWSSELFMEPEHASFMWGEHGFLSDDVQIATPPVRYAIQGVKQLLRKGHDLMVVSDRPSRLYDVTCAWLQQHELDLPVVFTHNKHSASVGTDGDRTKAQVAWQHRLTHVVEDAPHHAKSFADRSFVDRVYLLDYPHNQDVAHEKITRVHTWKEIA